MVIIILAASKKQDPHWIEAGHDAFLVLGSMTASSASDLLDLCRSEGSHFCSIKLFKGGENNPPAIHMQHSVLQL